MTEDTEAKQLGKVDQPEAESTLQGLEEFTRKATQDERNRLEGAIGSEALDVLADKKLDINIETEVKDGVSTFVVPHDNRVVSLTNNPNLGMIDVSFELTKDYLARKSGKFVDDESYSATSDKIQHGTIIFLKFMGGFMAKMPDDYRIRIIADERRMKLYKKFFDKLGKPNIILAPKSFSIELEDLKD